MRLFGLIGYPLAHSFSKKYFTDKFKNEGLTDCEYQNFEISSLLELTSIILQNPLLVGLNVTIPYKTNVIEMMHELSTDARTIGAVNTISIKNNNGKKILHGFNTDAYGFEKSLVPLLKPFHTKALIIGSGGASSAVAFVLSKLNIRYQIVNRTISKNNSQIKTFEEITETDIDECKLLINTTPLGMHPKIDTLPPIAYKGITDQHLAYDLVYNPEQTAFLMKADKQGAVIKNGLEMLHLQAEKAWDIWNEKE